MSNTSQNLPASITLVGAGKMGSAMLSGWLAMGLSGSAITILEPAPHPDLSALCGQHGISLNPPASAWAPAEGIDPRHQAADVGCSRILAPLINAKTLIISILAGKTIANIAARLPATSAIVRAMPNTPAAIGRGITGVAASTSVTTHQRAMTDALLGAVGAVEWLDSEALIDAVTAVSGSGPAYIFYLTEALAKAGEAAGLPADLAGRLARATVEGSGELMRLSPDLTPSKLRENVTSPGGTTAAALSVLMADEGLSPLMREAVLAALRRAGELSG